MTKEEFLTIATEKYEKLQEINQINDRTGGPVLSLRKGIRGYLERVWP